MGGSEARHRAIERIAQYTPPSEGFDTDETPQEIFGRNVFSRAVMQARLPRPVYESVIGWATQTGTPPPGGPPRLALQPRPGDDTEDMSVSSELLLIYLHLAAASHRRRRLHARDRFLLLAAACFARSSGRLHDYLVGHRVLGTYISNYYEKAMTRKDKARTLTVLWVGIGLSVWLIGEPIPAIILPLIALAVTIHILRLSPRG